MGKLKSMVKERDYNVDKYAAEREKIDNEIFMRDIEQDFDLRCQIKVYKDNDNVDVNNDNDDEIPQIPDSELINEFNEMKVSQNDDQKEEDNDYNNDNDNNDQEMLNID